MKSMGDHKTIISEPSQDDVVSALPTLSATISRDSSGTQFLGDLGAIEGKPSKERNYQKEEENEKRETGYERRENQSIYRGRSRAERSVCPSCAHPSGKGK
jgi:hypothetical protein